MELIKRMDGMIGLDYLLVSIENYNLKQLLFKMFTTSNLDDANLHLHLYYS